MFRWPPEENDALHLRGSRAEEEMATVKTQAAEPPAVDIGAAAHDKDLALGVPTRPLGFSQTWFSFDSLTERIC